MTLKTPDTFVATALQAGILSALTSALAGGPGVTPTAEIERAGRSMRALGAATAEGASS